MRVRNKRIKVRKDALFIIGTFVGFVLLSYGTGRLAYYLDPSTAVSETAFPATVTYTGVGIAFLIVGMGLLMFGSMVLFSLFHFLFEMEEVDQ